jgi:hypothetical protein
VRARVAAKQVSSGEGEMRGAAGTTAAQGARLRACDMQVGVRPRGLVIGRNRFG